MENENAKVKKTPKGLIIGIVVAVAIIAICAVLFILKPWATGYVATVDDLKITNQEYTVFSKISMTKFLSNIPDNTTTIEKYDWNTQKNGEAIKEQIKKETLDQIQEIKILMIKAKEAGLKIENDDLKSIDSNIIEQFGSEASAEEVIKSTYNVSLSDYKEVLKGITLSQKYYNSLGTNTKITVSDDEVKKYYDDNKKEFDKVTVTHVLISTVDANNVAVSAGKKSEAKAKADDILKQVQAGADIKELAVKYSDDKPSVDTNKGEYTFAKGEIAQEFEDWAFSNHSSGDAAVVETSYGFHIMKFQKRVETAYDDMKEQIKSSLNYSKFGEDFNNKLEGWKKEKRFEIVKNNSILEKTDLVIYRK